MPAKIEVEMPEDDKMVEEVMESKDKSKKKKKDKKEKKEKKKDKKKRKIEEVENGVASDDDSVKNKKVKVEDEAEAVDEKAAEVTPEITPELTPEQIEGAFTQFDISQKTVDKLKSRGITYLFPIQAKTYNHIINGEDLVAQARTGTGKTLSFAIPIVEMLQKNPCTTHGRKPRVIVMAPTRELAKQIADDFTSIGNSIKVLIVYGGTPYGPQISDLRRGVDIVVGTPGRINDLIEKGSLNLTQVKHAILDEVDQMLDMGFAEIVGQILQTAYAREEQADNPQTLLFSATMPSWVLDTARKYMRDDWKKVDLVGKDRVRTARNVQHLAIKSFWQDRPSTIGDVLSVYSGSHGRAMVFCQTKREADELATSTHIKQEAHVMHGDVPQEKREMVLQGFRDGRYKVLVTTDVAARGLDVPEVDLVIQCNPPKDTDSYIHRSGRTGRAGRTGTCVCFYKPQEEGVLKWVEKKAGVTFKKVGPPNAEDIIKAAAEDTARTLEEITGDTLAHFRPFAEKLIAEKGSVESLAAALAVISGTTDVKSRSLLCSQQGYTTYIFKTNILMHSKGYVWRALERQLPEDFKEKIRGMQFVKDKMACVFDVPVKEVDFLEKTWMDGKFDSLSKATELPELLEPEGGFNRGGRGSDRNGRGFRQRGSGRGRGFGSGRGRGPPRGRSYGDSNRYSNGSLPNKKITFD